MKSRVILFLLFLTSVIALSLAVAPASGDAGPVRWIHTNVGQSHHR